jgi:uncharacterized delta-60 repeat protein
MRKTARFTKARSPRAQRLASGAIATPIEALESRVFLSAASLDTTFGSGGKTSVQYIGPGSDWSGQLLQDTGGRLLATGYSFSTPAQPIVARLSANGVIDPAFGVGGVVTDFGVPAQLTAAVVDPSDNSVIEGSATQNVERIASNGSLDSNWIGPGTISTTTGSLYQIIMRGSGKSLLLCNQALVGLNANGTLDASFANGGIVSFPTATQASIYEFEPRSAIIESDGSLLVEGALLNRAGGSYQYSLAFQHYSAAGQLDTSFGNLSGASALTITSISGSGYALSTSVISTTGNTATFSGTDGTNAIVGRLSLATGSLDSTFGTSGLLRLHLSGSGYLERIQIAADSNGDIVGLDGDGSSPQQYYLVRLTPNGQLDPTFNGSGSVSVLGPAGSKFFFATGLAVQPNNQIVVLGFGSTDYDNPYAFELNRYSASGSLDTTFGDGSGGAGITLISTKSPALIHASGAALEPNGQLLLSGTSSGDALVARLNADGTPDTSFGNTGQGVADIDLGSDQDWASALAQQPDGKVVVVGSTDPTDGLQSSATDFAILRLNSDGSRDTSFGTNGVTLSDFTGKAQRLTQVAVEPNGQILAAGSQNESSGVVAVLLRYNANGTLDTSFGSAGEVVVGAGQAAPGENLISSIVPLSGGSVLVAGSLRSTSGSSAGAFVEEFNADGSISSQFASSGSYTEDINGSTNTTETAVGLLSNPSDGSLYLGGSSVAGSVAAFTLTKLTASGSVDPTFGSGGTAIVPLLSAQDQITSFTRAGNGDFELVGQHATTVQGQSTNTDLFGQLLPTGAPDASVGAGGLTILPLAQSDNFVFVGTNSLGQIVAAGQTSTTQTLSTWSALRLNGTALAPAVTTNPTSQAVTAGQAATFTAAASGSPTPTVQWYSEAPGASSFTAVPGATATTLLIPSTTTAQSGTQYEAVFSNGVGAPATTTAATLTVNPVPVSGSLSGTTSASAAPYNLTALGNADWVHFGVGGNYAVTDRKATGNSQISNFTTVGAGSFGGYTSSARTVTWGDGTPTASSTDTGYVWANTALGSGYSFTAPADTTTRTLYVYVGGYSSGATLTATLSDGSATPYSVNLSGNALYQNVVAITYAAASANQKLTISYTKTSNINGTGGSADLIAAWLAGAPVSTAPSITSNPTNQTVTAGQSATLTAAASGSPAPTVQWYSEAPGASSFTAISGATSTSLIVPSTTTAQSGTKYEAVFTNGVGSPATTTAATLTVNPAPVGGSLAGSSSASAAPYNLTALGTSDWVHFGVGGNYAVTDRKATGNGQISNFTAIGTGGFGGYTNSARTVTWGDGTPTASSTDSGYVWANNAIGSGFSFTAPADTTTRTLYVYVGGYSSGATLTATLSDGSAAPYTVNFSGNAAYQNVVAITYSAASANQKLTISYTKTSNLNGTSGSADLIAAWLTGAPVSTAPSITSNPTSTTVTAGQSATLTAAASGSPTPTVQWYSEAPGASSFTAISGATSTSLIVPSTTTAQSGTKYEAVFSNGVGSPATTTPATLTVNPAPVGGSLSGTSSASAAPYNLTTLGTSDWVHFGVGGNYAVTDRKATGNSQISNFTAVGTGGFGGYTNSARTVSWSDGSPTASSTDSGYIWANNAIGSGFSFTAPADTTTRTLYVYVGGYSSGATLTATLSDGSAAPYTVSLSGNAAYQNVIAITYSAASANQKLTISYTKTTNINGSGGSADLIAAWLH